MTEVKRLRQSKAGRLNEAVVLTAFSIRVFSCSYYSATRQSRFSPTNNTYRFFRAESISNFSALYIEIRIGPPEFSHLK